MPERLPCRVLPRAALAACACSLCLAGCAGLLPRGQAVSASGFDSFEAAALALERVVPYETGIDQLKALGYDLEHSKNVTRIPYPRLTARLSPDPGVPFEALDRGIRDCILAREACVAYEFHFGVVQRRREGGFLLDFLNFRRVTRIAGWRFEGLVAVRDGTVLFRSHAGEPRIDRTERQVNPLGPLQPAGESVGSIIAR
ncbi:hypothetical protein V4F39_02565 [Aquincola sp. MAHUQ-54]|uniref:Uncharacterized protein n=1 Tax=Aquincola agrisoli TaxID=3119538 RepID=A0AAW9QBK5_9BURK